MYSTHFLDLPPLRAAGGSVTLPQVDTGFAVLLQWPQPPEKSA